MIRIVCVAVVLLVGASAFAGDFQLIYERTGIELSDLRAINHVISSAGELLGFVYPDWREPGFLYCSLKEDSVYTVPCRMGLSSVCAYPGRGDTAFFVYALGFSGTKCSVYRWAFDDGFGILRQDSAAYHGAPSSFVFLYFTTSKISLFQVNQYEDPVVVVSSQWARGEQVAPDYPNWEEDFTYTEIFDFSLQHSMFTRAGTFVLPVEMNGISWIGFEDYFYTGCYTDYSQPNEPKICRYEVVGRSWALDSEQAVLWSTPFKDGQYTTAFHGDFIGTSPGDEVIVQSCRSCGPIIAYSTYFASSASPTTFCMKQDGDSLKTIWTRPAEKIVLGHVFRPQRYIAGLRGCQTMVAINYATGELVDSVPFNKYFRMFDFFESGDPPVLGMAGVSADTLFVYHMDSPTGTDDGTREDILPTDYTLSQNYPNPFNPSTTIEFDLPERSDVSLVVFNVLGQKVAELVKGEMAAGHHTAVWDGRGDDGVGVASGVYLYKLTAGDFVKTRKMVVVK